VFGIKLPVVLQLRAHPLLQPDAGLETTVYTTLASRVADGDLGLGPGLYFVSPLYIYFLAAILVFTHSFLAARIVQIAFGTLAGSSFSQTDEWFGRRAGWIAAATAAATSLFTFFESVLLQAIVTAAASAALAIGLNRATGPPRRWFLASGMAFGPATLNRPNIGLAALGVVSLMAIAGRRRQALAVTAGLLPALAPVTIRNIVVAGEWSPVSSQGGLNFYIGNNPDADGTYHSVPDITPNIGGQQEDARRELGVSLGMLGRNEEAVSQLDQAVALDPTDPTAQLNLAVACAQLGRLDQARAHAREALRLNPAYAKAREFLSALPK
jgi:tetratricopeptide (TPR) repeat protein